MRQSQIFIGREHSNVNAHAHIRLQPFTWNLSNGNMTLSLKSLHNAGGGVAWSPQGLLSYMFRLKPDKTR